MQVGRRQWPGARRPRVKTASGDAGGSRVFLFVTIQNKVHRMRIGGGGGGGGKGGALTAAARVALNSSLSTHTCEFKFKLGGAVA